MTGMQYVYHIMVDPFVTLQFVVLVLKLWTGFKVLNRRILQTVAPKTDSCVVSILLGRSGSSPGASSNFHELQRAHLLLHRAAEVLQDHFGMTVALDLTYTISGMICSSYEIVEAISREKEPVGILDEGQTRVSLVWMVVHLWKLSAMTLSCSAVSAEAAATRLLLQKVVALHSTPGPQLGALLRVVALSPQLRFTAAGFVTVDRSLLVSALTAAVTYLVLLTQFSGNY
ncbi:gustatory and pheromone receptor 32a-like [Schistocerca gregaria]|uniref:gustatory and pheromone receptor 32a-like n=1 Tax=Schistocerca gregaria TaxID=7010 RepID=UPI00211E5CD2|nr:gustatory and pheromone receptor 32a-like [Schistocerca gregaria]